MAHTSNDSGELRESAYLDTPPERLKVNGGLRQNLREIGMVECIMRKARLLLTSRSDAPLFASPDVIR